MDRALKFGGVLPDMDFETYSEAGCIWDETRKTWRAPKGAQKKGISAVGAAVYAEHPSTEVLILAYDLKDARSDPNVVFPIDVLRELVEEGVLGELAPQALTFMGGIYSSRRVRDELAPAITADLLAQEVDLALLVPV